MKTSITLSMVAMFFMTSEIQAQSFSVKAGGSLNQITDIVESSTQQEPGYKSESKNGYSPGFTISGAYEYAFTDNFSLATGLTFRQAGGRFSMEESYTSPFESYDLKYDAKITTYHLEIPLFLKAGFMAGNAKIYGLFGGFGNYSLSGKYRTETEYNMSDSFGNTYSGNESDSDRFDIGSNEDKDDMVAFNYGIIPGIGVQYKNIQIEATYNIGLNPVFHQSDEDNKMRSINLTIGYVFGK